VSFQSPFSIRLIFATLSSRIGHRRARAKRGQNQPRQNRMRWRNYFCVGVIVGKGSQTVNVEKFCTGAKSSHKQISIFFFDFLSATSRLCLVLR
jgi:hypothetical protein